jgi:MFS family permease
VKKQVAAHAEGNAAGVAEPSPVKPAAPRPGLWAGTMGALRQAAEIPVIFQSILLTGLFALFVGNAFQAQMPEFAHDLGNEKAGFSYSMLLGANAAGALVGGLLLETRGMSGASVRVAMTLTGLWCLVIAGFALTDNYPLAVVLMFVAGVLNLAFVSMTQTLVQWHSPAHLRGRMIGLYSFAQNGMRSFSGITIGVLGAVIGIHWSLALSAMALLASTMLLLGFSIRSGHLPGKA